MADEQQIDDATCLACSCMCDDISLTVVDNHVTSVRHACAIGQAWFQQEERTDTPICRIAGQPASVEAGIAAAAKLLTSARYPL
ncbi:MAG TPA: hypothetical protein VL096_07875, partial [Pirellulaceae bacterium]|nr:hypothetical protein [Pirellulaceae bacterium]